MKAILAGLGSAGFHWYKKLRDQGLIAAVVEPNAEMRRKMGSDGVPFYPSLAEAFEQEEPDFLVNVTPPMAHSQINHSAFDRKLPVLCEKPISFDWDESVGIVTRARLENIPFMIAENYRRLPAVRKLKQLLSQGTIGRISTIDILFARYHQVRRNYAVRMLDDVGVHHMDMIRYLTGAEGVRMRADLYNPAGGWEENGAVLNANLFLELQGGIRAGYSGTLASRGTQTPWCGNWRIEGTEGALEMTDQVVLLTRRGETERIDSFEDSRGTDCLGEFLASLAEGRDAETHAADYLKSEALVHFAKTANERKRTVDVTLPSIN